MTVWRRIRDFMLVLFQLACVAILIIDPDNGKIFIMEIMRFILAVAGVRYLIFYFTMARYMVDGKAILYKGGLYIDLAIFLGLIRYIPSMYVMLYVIGYFVIRGVYRIFKVYDTIKVRDKKWIRMALVAGWYILLAVIGIINIRSEHIMVYLFCVELVLSAMSRFVRATRKTSIVYIP